MSTPKFSIRFGVIPVVMALALVSGCKKSQHAGEMSQGAGGTSQQGTTGNGGQGAGSDAESEVAGNRGNGNGTAGESAGGVTTATTDSKGVTRNGVNGAGGTATANGTANGNGTGSTSATATGTGTSTTATTTPIAPETKCFSETFHHKSVVGHNTDEACSHHRNLITLKHDNVNSTSLCVRVNGTPVKWDRVKGHKNQIMIGHVAGPNAKVVATYCVGKTKCDEECKIPKDEFLDAIGGSENDVAVGHWDAEDAGDEALNTKLKKELADLDETGTSTSGIFKDWIEDTETPACGFKQAAADQGRS